MLDKISDPQILLEEAFKALYDSNLAAELSEIAKQQDLYAYQKAWCDKFAQVFSFVAKYGASVEVCELDRYLVEFRGIKYKVVVKKIGYSQQQLSNLSSDISSHYINDSLAAVYIEEEKLIADTIHEQIKYFDERFKKMNNELKKIEKELKK